MGLVRSGASPDIYLFDDSETALLERAMAALLRKAPEDAKRLSHLIEQLGDINSMIAATPSLRVAETLGNCSRDQTTLIAHLTQLDGLGGDLDLPFKGTLQRTFLICKIQLLRGFVKATGALVIEDPGVRPLNLQLRDELAQSIYTQMAEELLLALLRKPDVAAETKRHAAKQLIAIWDDATLEIDEFCPLLESAWRARNRITVGLGSLLGTTEYFKLVTQNCADQFLDYFVRDEVSEAENEAFSEFLFGLTFEELSTLKGRMRIEGLEAVSEGWATKVIGRQMEHECEATDADEIDPMSLYRSYSRRQLAADFRILAGGKGPQRTAEAYLMIYLLDHETDDD